MLRKLLTFSVVLAASITTSLILITAQQNDAQPNAASVKPANKQGDDSKDKQSQPYEQYERDMQSISERLQAIEREIATANSNHPKEEQPQWSWVFGSGPPIWSNWVLALVALGAGITAYLAFTHERDAVRLTQRADVLFEGIGLIPHTNPSTLGEDTMITWQVKNFGPTRANNLTVDSSVEIVGGTRAWNQPLNALPTIVLAAGGTMSGGLPPLGQLYDAESIRLASKGDKPLHVTTVITYRDAFGKTHHAKAISTYDGNEGRKSNFVVNHQLETD